jgi:hypothetical protein
LQQTTKTAGLLNIGYGSFAPVSKPSSCSIFDNFAMSQMGSLLPNVQTLEWRHRVNKSQFGAEILVSFGDFAAQAKTSYPVRILKFLRNLLSKLDFKKPPHWPRPEMPSIGDGDHLRSAPIRVPPENVGQNIADEMSSLG